MSMSINASFSSAYLQTTTSFVKQNQTATSADGKVDSGDSVSFGANGTLSAQDAIRVVNERAMDKIRGAVSEAREALGLPDGDALDTSAEATANRIADFALNAFDAWRKNHADLGEDDARAAFGQFIGGAIQQGIDEAKGILNALNALNPDVQDKITSIGDLIQKRLDAFVKGESNSTSAAV